MNCRGWDLDSRLRFAGPGLNDKLHHLYFNNYITLNSEIPEMWSLLLKKKNTTFTIIILCFWKP